MTTKLKNSVAWLCEYAPQGLLIENSWISDSTGDGIEVIDPSTEEVVAWVPKATPAQIDAALASTAKAQLVWQSLSSWKRSAILRSMAEIMRRDVDIYATVMTLEQGKPVEQARGEVLASADQFDWCADEARRIYGRIVSAKNQDDQIHIHRQPIGPVAAFAPWNFPMLLPARKISAALAAGCAAIAMPAVESPLSCLMIAKAGLEAGLPSGVLNMITGDPVLISRMLIDSDVIRKVSLTGSVPVGIQTLGRAAVKVKPVTVELGGHSPVIVLKDADIDAAAKICAIGKFRNAGQVCISANRFFVDEAVAPEFIAKFLEHTAQIRLGGGFDPETDMGPLTTERRLQAVQSMVDDAQSKGATVASGGKRSSNFSAGYFFEPTVLLNVSQDMEVMKEESFGPIAPIATFSTVAQAIELANSTVYGLAGFIFTKDLNEALQIALRLEVGMVGINNLTIATAEAPFGGVKMSGFGREGGSEGVEEFLTTKYINARMSVMSL